ncbi:hypothetical protein GSI_01423 [Ganoderma sinense ZZ0214-1]|uniref:Arrestin-like N-terminal domain-containing protein n=1 Tax=Ganoderma sinense ZZ0214-1 TaxID=1077348 RepID=A0A2G8SVD4_9APHY|nr:hypothetical protein GSI_01423 [Ganoderma sinense ZZ0214-1]
MSPSTHAISLSIPSSVYSSGSQVKGEVLLDFRQLTQDKIQEVHVKLRGFAQTLVTRDRTTLREVQPLIYSNLSVWSHGSEYPAPGSDLLRLPFYFHLPDNLPPSFQYSGFQKSASVLYSVTAVGVRPGTFQMNRRVRTPLVILPMDQLGMQVRRAMPSASFRTVYVEEKMRRGLWGDYGTARIEFSFPDVRVLPLFCDIPYQIKIVTTTAALSAAKAHALPAGKPLFPSPPSAHTDIDFKLCRCVYIRAKRFTAVGESDVAFILGEGTNPSKPHPAVVMEAQEKVWTPLRAPFEKEKAAADERGVWVQKVKFTSKMRITVPPTFATRLIHSEHFLYMRVPFAGIGNDLKLRVPVTINSGIDASMQLDQPGSSVGEGDAPPPPPMLDLPPAYWDVNDRDWSSLDEKD